MQTHLFKLVYMTLKSFEDYNNYFNFIQFTFNDLTVNIEQVQRVLDKHLCKVAAKIKIFTFISDSLCAALHVRCHHSNGSLSTCTYKSSIENRSHHVFDMALA